MCMYIYIYMYVCMLSSVGCLRDNKTQRVTSTCSEHKDVCDQMHVLIAIC